MAEEVNRNREPLFYSISPCDDNGCNKDHHVAITIYPDATTALCPRGNVLLDSLRKPFQHAELVVDDRTFFQWWNNTKNIGSFPYKVEKAEKGGKPFIKFNLKATHDQVLKLTKLVNKYNSQEHSCMGSVHQVLSEANILHIPFPMNQLPVTCSFLLRFHPQVTRIETVGKRAISKTKTACFAAAEVAFGTYLVAHKVATKVYSCISGVYQFAKQTFGISSSKTNHLAVPSA